MSLEESYWGDSPAERTLWLALGYSEAMVVLCDALIEDDYSRQSRSTRVVLYLAHHATELFLKGAIMACTGEPVRRTHDIGKLYAEYVSLYASPEFHFDIPFELTRPVNQELFEGIGIPEIPLAERYRYTTGSKGIPFNERDDFVPEEWGKKLGALHGRFNILFFKIRKLIYGNRPP